MYGIFTYIWVVSGVNAGFSYVMPFFFSVWNQKKKGALPTPPFFNLDQIPRFNKKPSKLILEMDLGSNILWIPLPIYPAGVVAVL